MLPAKLSRCHTSLMLLQYTNDLLIAKSGSLHRLSPQLVNRLTSNQGVFRGARQAQQGSSSSTYRKNANQSRHGHVERNNNRY